MNDADDPASQRGRGQSLRGMASALRWRPVNHGKVWLAAVTGWLIVVIVNAAVGRPLLATWPGAAVMLLIGLSESYYLRRTQTAQPAADRQQFSGRGGRTEQVQTGAKAVLYIMYIIGAEGIMRGFASIG